jgi:hypothetical protein
VVVVVRDSEINKDFDQYSFLNLCDYVLLKLHANHLQMREQ